MPEASGIERLGRVRLRGHPSEAMDLSAAGIVGDLLVVAGDEADRLLVFRREGDDYRLLPDCDVVLNDRLAEADIEGIACEGDLVHAIGSHSRKRPKPKPADSREANLARLETIGPPDPARDVLVRFRLASDGTHSELEATTLRPAIEADPILGPFAAIPCKENGVDIEGLAIRDGVLRVGFRGPVLQRGFVPVLSCRFASPIAATESLYLNLGGRGVRDLDRVDDGFLVLAGPVGDVPASFPVYLWDGGDCLPGGGQPTGAGRLALLGEIPTPEGGKAEGLVVESESAHDYTALILYDGLADGGATRFRIRKPPAP